MYFLSLEARHPRSRSRQGWFPLRLSPWLAGVLPPAASSHSGPSMQPHLWCDLLLLGYQPTGVGPILMTSFSLDHLSEGPVSKCNHSLKHWGARATIYEFRGTQISPYHLEFWSGRACREQTIWTASQPKQWKGWTTDAGTLPPPLLNWAEPHSSPFSREQLSANRMGLTPLGDNRPQMMDEYEVGEGQSLCLRVEQLCAGLFTSSHSRWLELWEDRLKVPSGTEKGVNSYVWDAHYWRPGEKFMVRYSLWNEKLKPYVLVWGKPPGHIKDGWGREPGTKHWVGWSFCDGCKRISPFWKDKPGSIYNE